METEEISHGGVLIVSKASNVSRKTIIKGKKELRDFVLPGSPCIASCGKGKGLRHSCYGPLN